MASLSSKVLNDVSFLRLINDESVKKLSEKLISGWAMLAKECQGCRVPFMRNRDGTEVCVGCELKKNPQSLGAQLTPFQKMSEKLDAGWKMTDLCCEKCKFTILFEPASKKGHCMKCGHSFEGEFLYNEEEFAQDTDEKKSRDKNKPQPESKKEEKKKSQEKLKEKLADESPEEKSDEEKKTKKEKKKEKKEKKGKKEKNVSKDKKEKKEKKEGKVMKETSDKKSEVEENEKKDTKDKKGKKEKKEKKEKKDKKRIKDESAEESSGSENENKSSEEDNEKKKKEKKKEKKDKLKKKVEKESLKSFSEDSGAEQELESKISSDESGEDIKKKKLKKKSKDDKKKKGKKDKKVKKSKIYEDSSDSEAETKEKEKKTPGKYLDLIKSLSVSDDNIEGDLKRYILKSPSTFSKIDKGITKAVDYFIQKIDESVEDDEVSSVMQAVKGLNGALDSKKELNNLFLSFYEGVKKFKLN